MKAHEVAGKLNIYSLSTKEDKIPGIQILPEYDPLFQKDGSLSTDRVSGTDEPATCV
jgi:hypothetical protein